MLAHGRVAYRLYYKPMPDGISRLRCYISFVEVVKLVAVVIGVCIGFTVGFVLGGTTVAILVVSSDVLDSKND